MKLTAPMPLTEHHVTDGFSCGIDSLDCQRRLNIDPPCRSNIDPGRVANS